MQHEDVRPPQFPPPGFAGHQVPQHLSPEHDGPVVEPPQEFDESDGYGDYFGNDVRHKFMMPDNRQWIEFKELSEGDIAKYNEILNRDITVVKNTGDARIKINQVEERHALLQVAVTGWHMMKRDRGGTFREQPFSNSGKGSTFMQWVNATSPTLVAALESEIRDKNPYLLVANNETLEAIDKQMADLQKQREQIVERMQGEGGSATS